MRRSDVQQLREERWVAIGDTDLEIKIVPAAAGWLPWGADGFSDEPLTQRDCIRVCREVFVDFKGYVDDEDKQVKNSLETRIELFSLAAVQKILKIHCFNAHMEALSGKDDAASD